MDFYKSCSNFYPGVKIGPALGVMGFPYNFIHIVKKKMFMASSSLKVVQRIQFHVELWLSW